MAATCMEATDARTAAKRKVLKFIVADFSRCVLVGVGFVSVMSGTAVAWGVKSAKGGDNKLCTSFINYTSVCCTAWDCRRAGGCDDVADCCYFKR